MLFCWGMVELRRKTEKLDISPTVWAMTLDLALLRGWIPGSISERGWPADYIANDGQTVSAEDAKNLADALGRGDDLAKRAIEDWQAGQIRPAQKLRTPASGFAWFNSPQGLEHLRRLMAFLRGGAFEIH